MRGERERIDGRSEPRRGDPGLGVYLRGHLRERVGVDVNEIAGASVSVVVPHARAGAMTVALENDTRGAAAWAVGFGHPQAVAPTQFPPGNARQQGGYAAFLDVFLPPSSAPAAVLPAGKAEGTHAPAGFVIAAGADFLFG